MTSYTPTVIRRSDPSRVEIEWSDGEKTVYSPAELRGLCPCAQCVNEISGQRMNDPASVPAELVQSDLQMIGNYAISMRFSDGHHTGIYTFKYLRDNAPEKAPDRAPGENRDASDAGSHGEVRSPSQGAHAPDHSRDRAAGAGDRETDRERPTG